MLKKLGFMLVFTLFAVIGLTANSGQTYAATDYTVTGNLYVKGTDNKINGLSAYLTNSFVMPLTAASKNATMTKEDDGTYTLSVPVINNTFALIELGTPTTNTVSNIVATRNTGTYGTNTNGRITNVAMTIAYGTTSVYFTGNHQYANYPIHRGDKDFNLTLDVDWSNVK